MAFGNRRLGARGMVAVYATLAMLWIIGGDLLLGGFAGEDATVVAANIGKGAAFVLVTGVVLYLLVRRDEQLLLRANREVVNTGAEVDRLASFPRLSPNPIVALSSEGTVVYANEAARRAAEEAGAQLTSILPVGFAGMAGQCLGTTLPINGQERSIGNRIWRWDLFPVDGGSVYAYGEDATEEIALLAQLTHAAKMEAVGRLAAGVAHNFNNALLAVTGYTQLLKDELPQDDERVQDDLRQIELAAGHAADLVRRLMAFSRRDAPVTDVTDLREMVRDVLPLVRQLMPKTIALDSVVDGPEVPVRMPRGEIEEVLMNLAVNASDAMPGGGHLFVAVEEHGQGEARRANVVVRDTGVGIEPAIQARIFEPFFTTKPAGKGTGLGLASAYAAVTRQGGTIRVESEPGLGTTFTIELPVAAEAEQLGLREAAS
ncbi:MAG: hypothetical protein IT303_01840 [Dehalococcoidia bacterium]|nr:hypothetical protein [Dehalococcoidia bacterium]